MNPLSRISPLFFFQNRFIFLIFALLGSLSLWIALIAEIFFGMVPCFLCLVERVIWSVTALTGLLGLGLLSQGKGAMVIKYTLGLIMVCHILVSGYHLLVENQIIEGASMCKATQQAPVSIESLWNNSTATPTMSSCETISWEIGGVSMVLVNLIIGFILFLYIGVVIFIDHRKNQKKISPSQESAKSP